MAFPVLNMSSILGQEDPVKQYDPIAARTSAAQLQNLQGAGVLQGQQIAAGTDVAKTRQAGMQADAEVTRIMQTAKFDDKGNLDPATEAALTQNASPHAQAILTNLSTISSRNSNIARDTALTKQGEDAGNRADLQLLEQIRQHKQDFAQKENETARKAAMPNVLKSPGGAYTLNPDTGGYEFVEGSGPAPKSATTTDYDQKIADYNKHPELTSKFGKDDTGYELWQKDQQVQAAKAGRAPSTAADTRLDRSYQFNSTQLEKIEKPISDSIVRFSRLADTINQSTPQADALIAPELMTVMAGGQGSGVRITEAEIARIIGGRTNFESLKAAVNKWRLDPTKALSVTPAQRDQIRQLMAVVSQKLMDKQQVIDSANDELINATTVEAHRQAVNKVRKALADIDAPAAPAAATPASSAGWSVKVKK